MPAIVQLHQSDGQAALTRAWGRTAARARRAFIYSSRERTHSEPPLKPSDLGLGGFLDIPSAVTCVYNEQWSTTTDRHGLDHSWGWSIRGGLTVDPNSFHSRKHCPYRPKTLHSKKSLTRKLPKLHSSLCSLALVAVSSLNERALCWQTHVGFCGAENPHFQH